MDKATEIGQQIVVLDRGFVYAGRVRVEAEKVTISDAKCIRRWGTTRGLGELAKNGPTKKTVLDPAGEVVAPMKSVIHFIKCEMPL